MPYGEYPFFAQRELSEWSGGELYAILALGYYAKSPGLSAASSYAAAWAGTIS